MKTLIKFIKVQPVPLPMKGTGCQVLQIRANRHWSGRDTGDGYHGTKKWGDAEKRHLAFPL